MTIGELKRILEKIPNGMEIVLETEKGRFVPRFKFVTIQMLSKMEVDKGELDPMKPNSGVIIF